MTKAGQPGSIKDKRDGTMENFDLMKKPFLLSLLMLVCAACTRPPETSLNVTMSLGEQEWQVLREEVFPRFEKRTGVKVQAYQVDSGQLAVKLEALAQGGGGGIDLFAQDNMNLAPLVNKGLVEDLSDFSGDIPANVYPNLIQAGRFQDRLYFFPFRPNVQITYYHAPALQRSGLTPPRTWQDLLAAAKRLKEREGQGKVLIKGYGGAPTATQIYEFVLQAGGEPLAFADSGCVAAFEFLQQLRPYLSPEFVRAKWDTTNDILARQEAYIAANWPFGVVTLVKDYGLKHIRAYSGWAGPAGEQHVIGGDVFGIPKTSRNKQAAREFMAFMQSQEIQELLTARLGWPSIRDDAYAQVEPWQQPYFAAVQQALRHGRFRENVTWWPLYEKYVNLAFQDIVVQGKDVLSTLQTYKQELEKAKASF